MCKTSISTLIALLLLAQPAVARKWTDITGKHSVEADLESVTRDTVRLRKSNGRTTTLPIRKLCPADQQFARLRFSQPDEAIRHELRQKTELEFDKVPLNQALQTIARQHQIPVFLNRSSFSGERVDAKAPVSGSSDDDTLAELLDGLLEPLKLRWTVNHDVVYVTTRSVAIGMLETRVYRLLGPANISTLAEKLKTDVAPDRWNHVGGPGTIGALGNALIVLQTVSVHEEIRTGFKDQLARVVGRPGGPLPARALSKVIDCEFPATPLAEVVAALSKEHEVPIKIDSESLEQRGLSKLLVQLDASGIRLNSALHLITSQFFLTWFADKDRLLITTREAPTAEPHSIDYDIKNIVRDANQANMLAQIIMATIAPSTWDRVGRQGSVQAMPDGSLQVKQTYRVHQQVAQLLADLNAAFGNR